MSCQPLTVEKTLCHHRNAVLWPISHTVSMRRREALWHMTSTILMTLCGGGFAFAKMAPVRALNLPPQERQWWRVLHDGVRPSSHTSLLPHLGQNGS